MAKFEKRPRSTGKDGSAERSDKGDGEKSKGSSGYKAKRSFTRNKSLRADEKRGGDRKRPFNRDDRKSEGGERRDRERSGDKPGGPFKREDRGERRERPFSREKRDTDSPRRERPFSRERSDSDAPRRERPFNRERKDSDEPRRERPFSREKSDSDAPRRERPFSRERKDSDSPRRERPYSRERKDSDGPRRDRPFRKEGSDDRGERAPYRRRDDAAPGGERRERSEGRGDRPFRKEGGERTEHSKRAGRRPYDRDKPRKSSGRDDEGAPKRVKHDEFDEGRAFSKRDRDDKAPGKPKGPAPTRKQAAGDGLIRLNKYLANSGVSSRREADKLIESGAVSVNGEVITQLGYKIKEGDVVNYGGQSIKGERKVYLLLNKPKDYITTVEDDRDRKTVMELIQGACRERVYPVGRLDRNTTGLLLFTNDGELTTKLTHPKYGVKKVYQVTLNKGLKTDDFKAIVDGIELEDGVIKADDVAFVGEGKKEVGVEIHSGRNRVVRRMFEHLGYDVIKLDRVVFAGLTKKDLPRGKHRFLTAKEVSFLKMIG